MGSARRMCIAATVICFITPSFCAARTAEPLEQCSSAYNAGSLPEARALYFPAAKSLGLLKTIEVWKGYSSITNTDFDYRNLGRVAGDVTVPAEKQKNYLFVSEE